MKYLYIFKKQNGELFLEEETIAFKHIFQGENNREPFQYLGRFDSNEHALSQYDIVDKVKQFKKDLIAESPELQKAMDNGAKTGSFSPVENDFTKKVHDYSLKLEEERMEKFVSIAKKEYMDKNLNISTPGGNRDFIINSIR
jgi:hypothetical protein